jgi:hypothetical protein
VETDATEFVEIDHLRDELFLRFCPNYRHTAPDFRKFPCRKADRTGHAAKVRDGWKLLGRDRKKCATG